MSELVIREIKQNEISFLSEMLYEAIFTATGEQKLPKEIINEPTLNNYIKDFGRKDDVCLVCVIEKNLVGAIWTRQFTESNKGYGFINSKTPELSMAIKENFRANGIGKILLERMLKLLFELNYKQVSLSVDKRNFAFNFYKNHNFVEVDFDKNSIKMVRKLN